MPKVENVSVTGLAASIVRSSYPHHPENTSALVFNDLLVKTYTDLASYDLGMEVDNPLISRAIKLANVKGGGHDQFLTGINVSFDLTFSNKAWVEMERYKFMNFVSSTSTMHSLSYMSLDEHCNKYVSRSQVERLYELRDQYNRETDQDAKDNLRLEILYSLPAGFEITAGMVTNYRCLKNIYSQRRHHALPDWQVFCDWIETLEFADEFITGKFISEVKHG